VAEQKLDLFDISAVLSAGFAQVRRRLWAPYRAIPISLAQNSTTDLSFC
jgi:hypothetical protein